MNFLAVVCVVVLALHGAESACQDIGNTRTCVAYKRYCDIDGVTWGGTVFWKKCLKTCNKCGGSDDVGSDDSGSSDCKDESSSCSRWKKWCKCGKFSDGTTVWSICKKTCNKCDKGDKKEEEKEEEKQKQKQKQKQKEEEKEEEKEDDNCVDKYASSCRGASDNMCQNGQFGDGAPYWKYCMKSCSCCDGSCQKRQDKIDAACGDKSSGPSTHFFNKDVLDYHNELRAKHQNTPSMTWDKTLQGYATKHCAAMVSANKGLWHSTSEDRGGAGENIYMSGMMKKQMCNRVGSLAAQAWYNEIADYDFATGSQLAGHEDAVIGHFTQNVWTTSTKLGCAYCANAGLTQVFVSCNYAKPGNWRGQYVKFVMPLKARRVLELRKREEINIPARDAQSFLIPERAEPEEGQTPFDSGEDQFEVMERGEPHDGGVDLY